MGAVQPAQLAYSRHPTEPKFAEPKFAEPDAQGNHHQQLGEFSTTGGETRSMNDVWFAVRTLPHTLKTTPNAANPTPWSLAA